jgi:hypothetical protein
VISGGGEHAADLVVATFMEGDEGFLFAEDFKLGREEGLGLAVEEKGAGGEEGGLVAEEGAVEGDVIDFPAGRLGVDDFVE